MLSYISGYIIEQLKSKQMKGEYQYPRNQLYQMFFVMTRLDAPKFCKLDFAVNFGIPPDIKSKMIDLIENSTSKPQFIAFLKKLDTMVLLKLHKYFFWADKKLHSVFFIENKDQISEDLLVDFKDEEDVKQFKQSEHLANKKKNIQPVEEKPKVIDMQRSKNKLTKEDLLFNNR